MDKSDEKKVPEITDLFNLRIFGMDFGQIVKNWLGVADLAALRDPAKVEEVRRRVEARRKELKEAQEQFRKKYGDTIRFDYDIRIRSLLGGNEEFRIGGGEFFETLDKFARESARLRSPSYPGKVVVPYKRPDGVREPPVDIIEHEDRIEVISELPGVDEKDIELKIEEDKLTLSTNASERKYLAEVNLPAKVIQEPYGKTYLNGVLRIDLKKTEHP